MSATDYTFTELKAELAAEGYDYLSDTRQGYFINEAYAALCDEEFWPFLEASSSGAAPLTISDLKTVESVRDTVQNRMLDHRERIVLQENFTDLTITGSPRYYYVTGGTVVRTYPVGGTLAVNYWKTPTLMSTGSDTPLVPQRFRRLLLDYAVREAAMDNNDLDDVAAVQAKIDRRLQVMREALLVQHRRGDYIDVVQGSEDG